MELLIAQTIRRHRKALDITQEQLAAALGISPQSISKWECGDGYPDITMLPVIANHFGITVDALIGNDELGREEDLRNFWDEEEALRDEPEKRLELCRRYYRKYPGNFAIMNLIGSIIVHDNLKNELPFLREVCEKIIDDCTDQYYRQHAAGYMSAFCEDGELERWLDLCAPSYSAYRGEILEERLWKQGKRDECREQNMVNNLELILHWMRSRGRYHGKPELSIPAQKRYMAFIEQIVGDGTVPDAWLVPYALATIRLAAAQFGCGDNEAGFVTLERAMQLYERWFAIPNESVLPLGAMFEGMSIRKYGWKVITASGEEKHLSGAYHLFTYTGQLYAILTAPHGWEWWNGVRGTERFRAFVTRAEKLQEKYGE